MHSLDVIRKTNRDQVLREWGAAVFAGDLDLAHKIHEAHPDLFAQDRWAYEVYNQ